MLIIFWPFLSIDNIEYSCALRKEFLHGIEVLGESGRGAVMRSLARYSLDLDNPNLSIDELTLGLAKIIGNDSAELVMQIVISRLNRTFDWRPAHRR